MWNRLFHVKHCVACEAKDSEIQHLRGLLERATILPVRQAAPKPVQPAPLNLAEAPSEPPSSARVERPRRRTSADDLEGTYGSGVRVPSAAA